MNKEVSEWMNEWENDLTNEWFVSCVLLLFQNLFFSIIHTLQVRIVLPIHVNAEIYGRLIRSHIMCFCWGKLEVHYVESWCRCIQKALWCVWVVTCTKTDIFINNNLHNVWMTQTSCQCDSAHPYWWQIQWYVIRPFMARSMYEEHWELHEVKNWHQWTQWLSAFYLIQQPHCIWKYLGL